MPGSTLPSPLLVPFATLLMLCLTAMIASAIVGDGLSTLVFVVGVVGSLLGLLGTGARL